MALSLRPYLLNRYVVLVFSIPAIGYLVFLSQFFIGEPSEPVRLVLEALFLPALPVMTLYSSLLQLFPAVNQSLGTIGFFVFAYMIAVVFVSGVHVSLVIHRNRGLINTERDDDAD